MKNYASILPCSFSHYFIFNMPLRCPMTMSSFSPYPDGPLTIQRHISYMLYKNKFHEKSICVLIYHQCTYSQIVRTISQTASSLLNWQDWQTSHCYPDNDINIISTKELGNWKCAIFSLFKYVEVNNEEKIHYSYNENKTRSFVCVCVRGLEYR